MKRWLRLYGSGKLGHREGSQESGGEEVGLTTGEGEREGLGEQLQASRPVTGTVVEEAQIVAEERTESTVQHRTDQTNRSEMSQGTELLRDQDYK